MPGQSVVITDKDGGLMTELRSPKGDIPVYFSSSGDRHYWNEIIDCSGQGNFTVHNPPNGKKFYVESMVMCFSGPGKVKLKSGTTLISGPMKFQAYAVYTISHGDSKLYGRAIDDPLILKSFDESVDVGGYATGFDE